MEHELDNFDHELDEFDHEFHERSSKKSKVYRKVVISEPYNPLYDVSVTKYLTHAGTNCPCSNMHVAKDYLYDPSDPLTKKTTDTFGLILQGLVDGETRIEVFYFVCLVSCSLLLVSSPYCLVSSPFCIASFALLLSITDMYDFCL